MIRRYDYQKMKKQIIEDESVTRDKGPELLKQDAIQKMLKDRGKTRGGRK